MFPIPKIEKHIFMQTYRLYICPIVSKHIIVVRQASEKVCESSPLRCFFEEILQNQQQMKKRVEHPEHPKNTKRINSSTIITCRVQKQDTHTPGKIVRAGSHGGTAGQCGDRQRRTPTGRVAQAKHAPLALQTMKNNFLGVFQETRRKEISFKPMVEQNERLTRGLPAGREALCVLGC